MLAYEQDRQRPHDAVEVGTRWFVWGYHWDITHQRTVVGGVREVRMSLGKGKRGSWIPAWRVQRYGRVSGS